MSKKSLMQMLIVSADTGVGFSIPAEEVEQDLPPDWRERVRAAAGVEDIDVPFVFFQDGRVEAQFGMPFDEPPPGQESSGSDGAGGGTDGAGSDGAG